MATFYEGGIDLFEAISYTEPHPNTIQFIDQSINHATQYLSDTAQSFINHARQMHEQVMSGEAFRVAKAAARQVLTQWQPNTIRYLNTVDQLQTAPQVMVRWLMAEPTTRSLYHQNRCDGYGDHYNDYEPGKIGENHSDWQQVMDGIVVDNENDDGWYYTQYYVDIPDDERELRSDEQFDILKSWQHLSNAIHEGKDDPTSRWNAEL